MRRDGEVVAISNPDSGVTFHDSQTLGLVGTFKGGPASEMAFRPGELISRAGDGQLVGRPDPRPRPGAGAAARLRKLGTVEPSRSEGPLTAIFLPDGHTVLVTTADGATYQRDTDPRSWLEAACRIAGRNLSTAEWRESFGERPYRLTCPDASRT